MTTARLQVIFRLQSPLCIARRPTAPGQPIETLDYLSGTVVRGGIATEWLRGRRFHELDAAEQPTFRALFLNPALVFGNGCPLPGAQIGVPVEVVPQTAWARKYDTKGWLYDKGEGVLDQLPTLLCQQDPNADREGDATLDRFERPFTYRNRDDTYQDVPVVKRLITRTALDSRRGTARERFLYTLEALETGQSFRSTIQGPAELVAQVQAMLEHSPTLGMGQGRSRGLGRVVVDRVNELPGEPQETTAAVMEHIERFTERVKQLAGGPLYDEEGMPLSADTMLLPVTLESDVLLRDTYLLPSSDPQPTTTLGRSLALSESLVQHMQLHRPGLVQSSHWIGGWDELRRIPRPPQLAVAMRSVWTFRVPQAQLQEAVEWWQVVQQQGLGERRNEGYGRVRLCHPLHMREGKQ